MMLLGVYTNALQCMHGVPMVGFLFLFFLLHCMQTHLAGMLFWLA